MVADVAVVLFSSCAAFQFRPFLRSIMILLIRFHTDEIGRDRKNIKEKKEEKERKKEKVRKKHTSWTEPKIKGEVEEEKRRSNSGAEAMEF